MSRVRVLHLAKFYSPVKGGLETALQTLCAGEMQSVHTRALVMNRSHETTHEVVDNVAVTRVGSWLTIGSVSIAPTLALWLGRARADVLVLHEPNPMALLAYFISRPKAPLIVWYHGEVVRPAWRDRLFYHPLLRFALARVSCVVIASPQIGETRALAPYRSKCVLIPYGLDPDRYRPTSTVIARANALRANARRPILLFVGRLVPYEGLNVLFRALPGLNVRMVIVGDGPLRTALEAEARKLHIADQLQFVGEVSDAERLVWLHACNALVLPSLTRQESFGMVQLEAMLCGRPVISTNVPTGVPWLNVHGETGLVVRASDAESLRGAIERLIADDELRQVLGSGARARALTLFTADRMCASAVALYQSVWDAARLAQKQDAHSFARRSADGAPG